MPDYSNSELFVEGLAAFTAWLAPLKDSFTGCDSPRAYESLLSDFITELLQADTLVNSNQPLVPEQLGTLYEYLRSFHLEWTAGAPAFVPNINARRNQGLFYTPDAIVGHIVHQTFKAFGQADLESLLNLKILDPSVGAGRFLVRVLKAMTRLSDKERELIALKFTMNMTNRAIAETTGLGESNVGVILFRAMKTLKGLLGPETV